MKTIKFKKVENRIDYLAVDNKTAISAEGELFTISDLVKHDDKSAGTATIKKFSIDKSTNDVIAHTEKGKAKICFISKVNQQDI